MNAAIVEVAGEEFEIDHCATCRSMWIDAHEKVRVDDAKSVTNRGQARLDSILSPRDSSVGDRLASSPLLQRLAARTAYRQPSTFLEAAQSYHADGARLPTYGTAIVMLIVSAALYFIVMTYFPNFPF